MREEFPHSLAHAKFIHLSNENKQLNEQESNTLTGMNLFSGAGFARTIQSLMFARI